jgi:hypothetical protein
VVSVSYWKVRPLAASPMKANSPGSASTADWLAVVDGPPAVAAGEAEAGPVDAGDDGADGADGTAVAAGVAGDEGAVLPQADSPISSPTRIGRPAAILARVEPGSLKRAAAPDRRPVA